MTTKEITAKAVAEVAEMLARIDGQQEEALCDAILEARRVYVAGAGRAGNLMKGFGMRMMHMDLHSYVVGESVTPAIGAGDLLIIGSGSGETGSMVSSATKAKKLGAKVAIITASPDSTVARMADYVVYIPAISKMVSHDEVPSFQPMANVFEQSMLFLQDAITMTLMSRLNKTSDQMMLNHANLE
ncbi:MAG: 6-phospho-3-hexuloisomerase [Oscillospiraceae bacterium]|nr:6-phospho-3-hexuloisomerase [Oscillospiraceae bacterium]MBQ8669980.1 6-phospho-3-hexuloisomerase [Oscillospiraceae bacterium]MBQ9109228.1 6-phospho-3-hexuloisomerase [Oscillospiraceae bacterium]